MKLKSIAFIVISLTAHLSFANRLDSVVCLLLDAKQQYNLKLISAFAFQKSNSTIGHIRAEFNLNNKKAYFYVQEFNQGIERLVISTDDKPFTQNSKNIINFSTHERYSLSYSNLTNGSDSVAILDIKSSDYGIECREKNWSDLLPEINSGKIINAN